jgi:hypothetical protein
MSPKNKGEKLWYERPEWIALIGSIIVVMAQISGQLATTMLPIMFGPSDQSEFGLSVDPVGHIIESAYELPAYLNSTVEVFDIHQIIKPYRYAVFLKGLYVPEGIGITFDKPEGKPPFKSMMKIYVSRNCTPGEYPIVVQGRGGDGITRDTTYLLEFRKKEGVPINFSIAG